MTSHAWLEDARCRGHDTNLWFPDPETYTDLPTRRAAERAAKRICRDCPVQAECQTAGRTESHGIWAGRTPRERARQPHRRTAA